jgi:hypothetical protein
MTNAAEHSCWVKPKPSTFIKKMSVLCCLFSKNMTRLLSRSKYLLSLYKNQGNFSPKGKYRLESHSWYDNRPSRAKMTGWLFLTEFLSIFAQVNRLQSL